MSLALHELNEAQRDAVINTEGPIMIIAGAGSGKTRVLTFRIAYLLENGVNPFEILSLTFTNKAAREMRNRIELLIGGVAKNIWMGTFHSVFSKILRIEANYINYPSNFTIYDTDDAKSVIKSILKDQNLGVDVYKPGMVVNRISLAKNNFITPDAYLANADVVADDTATGKPKLGLIYKMYADRCFKAGAMDFDDLLLKTYELFSNHIGVLNKYQQKFKYLMIDEYQDTNELQYLIIKKLASSSRNLCVVGDDSQSIYGFRGAQIENILNFKSDYPDMRVYKLEQNYRSTKTIVEAADSIIKKNKIRLEKKIWTANEDGHLIKVYKAPTDNEEGVFVARSIFEEKMNTRSMNSDFVVLYRTNSQSRAIEEALRRQSLPYKIIGGLSFYQRKEIKDMLAYFRLAINPNDEEAFKRIINYPTRGIGDVTVNKIIANARDKDTTLWVAAKEAAEYGIEGRRIKVLSDWVSLIEVFVSFAEARDAYEAASEIAKGSGLNKSLNEDKTIEGLGRYENIQELLGAIKEFTEDPDREDKSLGIFMQEVALLTDTDKKDNDDDAITLMTIHQAKGLEFDFVFVVGLEENLFPSQMSLGSNEDLEEERRLFYVAVTRAKKKAWLSYATTRFRYGSMIYADASRFINEIDSKYLNYLVPEQPVVAKMPSNFDRLRGIRGGNQPLESQTSKLYTSPTPVKATIKKPDYIPNENFTPSDLTKLLADTEVEHKVFGLGRVIDIEGIGDQRKATIFFQEHGEKQIILKFAKMQILE